MSDIRHIFHVSSGKCLPTQTVEHTFVHAPPLFKRFCYYTNIQFTVCQLLESIHMLRKAPPSLR